MQWLICHILRDDYTFAELTTRILRLTRVQIQNFIVEYMAERGVWIQYEQNVSRIPWRELIRYAAEKKQSVVELLHMYRPSLPTDEMSRDDIARAAGFLHARGLGAYATSLDGWFGIGRMDFLDLDICSDIIVRDTLDREVILKAAELGWIDVEEVVQVARERARRLILKADAACPVQDAFLGTIKGVTEEPRLSSEMHVRVGVVDCSQDGVHITPRCNRTVWSGILQNVDEGASVSLMQRRDFAANNSVWADNRNRSGRPTAASKAQMEEIRASLVNQLPALLPRHVPGWVVMTAEERARAATTTSASTTCHLPPLPTTPSQNPHRSKSKDLRKAATTRVLQNRVSAPGAECVVEHLFDSPNTCEVIAAAGKRVSTASRTLDANGHAQDLSAPTRSASEPTEVARLSYTGASDSVQLPAAQACSAELRKALDSKFAGYLRAENRAVCVKRKRSMSKSDVVEAEDDTDYMPTKESATKRKLTTVQQSKGEQTVERGMKRRVSPHDCKTPTRAVASRTHTNGPLVVKQKASKQPRARVHEDGDLEHVPLERQHKRRSTKNQSFRGGNGVDDGSNEPLESEPVRTKKNTEPIFGIPRHQELCGPLERAEDVEYAWSADAAEFAMVCKRAKYALKADGVDNAGQDGEKEKDAARMDEALYTLMRLQTRFGVVEATQKSCAAQDAERARFAGCADWATYAADAEVAEYVWEGGKSFEDDDAREME